jgi:hypothetical protein
VDLDPAVAATTRGTVDIGSGEIESTTPKKVRPFYQREAQAARSTAHFKHPFAGRAVDEVEERLPKHQTPSRKTCLLRTLPW